MKPLILITNDDGYDSKGIIEVAKIATNFGEVIIAAPKRYRSGQSRAITLRKPITIDEKSIDGIKTFIIDGTPASCVIIALELLDRKPDLVVSGINNGENLAAAMTMSGTLNAALEAVTYGIPAIAVSLQRPELFPKNQVKFNNAAKITAGFIEKMLKGKFKSKLLNINIPLNANINTSIIYGKPSRRKLHWPKVFKKKGNYFIDFERDYSNLEEGSDADIVINNNSISVTALDYLIASA